MVRLSDRINAAMSMVRCPGCREWVTPTFIVEPSDTTNQEETNEGGKRWSFIWLPPRGEVCPECQFPLERYKHRAKWVGTFLTGLVLAVFAAVFYALILMGNMGLGAIRGIANVAGLAGAAAIIVGLLGIIIGGKHGTQTPQN